jgi:hypothetical protein
MSDGANLGTSKGGEHNYAGCIRYVLDPFHINFAI